MKSGRDEGGEAAREEERKVDGMKGGIYERRTLERRGGMEEKENKR